ncbi:hypothetical protein FQA39_LY05377 [Lamprigera yunnana]|nr:hypothetical protein FQA39_LY05377 [Lamprigera yunnana]
MEYTISKNKGEKLLQSQHSDNTFLAHTAATLKRFATYYRHLVKSEIFNTVQKYKYETIMGDPRNERTPNSQFLSTSPSTSTHYSSIELIQNSAFLQEQDNIVLHFHQVQPNTDDITKIVKPPSEVAQLKVEIYKSITLINDGSGNDEFEKFLSETEKNLLNSYGRIVIRDKRGRAGSENLDGTKILYKYALKCGINKPKSITATNLRKHFATITQSLQFSEADMEQLSKFMGHTFNTHCKIYRLFDNIYQTAKVSKLPLLMSEGGVKQ